MTQAVLERIKPLLEEADRAFRTDPSYCIEFAKAAATHVERLHGPAGSLMLQGV